MTNYLRYVPTIIWAIIIWRLTTTAQIVVTSDSWLQNLLMMGAHFTFFGIQAAWLFYAYPNRLSAITLTSFYGAIIELRQLTVPGRSADPLDWALDTLGAITFLFLLKNFQNKINLRIGEFMI